MLTYLLVLLLNQSPTAEFVQELRPALTEGRVVQVATHIDAAAEKYNVSPRILTAIVRTESDFRSGLKSCFIVLRHKRCEVACDYGIAQVNDTWIRKWRLDPKRLQYDDRYNLMAAARILAILQKQFGDLEENWYGRYHSGTPSKRQLYENKLAPLMESGQET